MSGPKSRRRSLLIKAEDRFLRLGPPSSRAFSQFGHLQKTRGYDVAAAVPKKVIVMRLTHLLKVKSQLLYNTSYIFAHPFKIRDPAFMKTNS